MAGFLTTHVLNTASGRPAQGLKIELFKIEGDIRKSYRLMTSRRASTSWSFMPVTTWMRLAHRQKHHGSSTLFRSALACQMHRIIMCPCCCRPLAIRPTVAVEPARNCL
jgi:5-hydroxyisourate hydrolase